MKRLIRCPICISLLLLVGVVAGLPPRTARAGGDGSTTVTDSPAVSADLHAGFATLLDRYRRDDGVRYDAWHAASSDVSALTDYVNRLESVDPAGLSKADALAYWINLYNAATVELVLEHYPVESIKDIGGWFSSPWKQEVVTVAGRTLTLNQIENDVIRPTYGDPRIHFALNCASVGCPLLAAEPYRGDALDAQLDAASRFAMNDPRWVDSTGDRTRLTKIFDWYGDDFKTDGESVASFINRYRAPEVSPVDTSDSSYLDYDWDLNKVPETEG